MGRGKNSSAQLSKKRESDSRGCTDTQKTGESDAQNGEMTKRSNEV